MWVRAGRPYINTVVSPRYVHISLPISELSQSISGTKTVAGLVLICNTQSVTIKTTHPVEPELSPRSQQGNAASALHNMKLQFYRPQYSPSPEPQTLGEQIRDLFYTEDSVNLESMNTPGLPGPEPVLVSYLSCSTAW